MLSFSIFVYWPCLSNMYANIPINTAVRSFSRCQQRTEAVAIVINKTSERTEHREEAIYPLYIAHHILYPGSIYLL